MCPRHALACSRAADERGVALVVALAFMLALSIAVASALAFSATNSRTADYSKENRKALYLAEAGLSNARSTLWASLDPRDEDAVPSRTATLENGTVTYSGDYLSETAVWTLTGTGTVTNPSGGPPITRSVSSQVRVVDAPANSSTEAWDYVFSDTTRGCMDVKNDVVIDAPLYVRGSLCMDNNAVASGSLVQVEGTLTLADASSIGTSSNWIADARIGGGCTGGFPNPHPCTDADGVYALLVTSTTEGLSKPAATIPYWYANASPGPATGCTTGSFPSAFDTDTVMNGTSPTVDLLPAAPYDCQTADGRIAWDPSSGILTIDGTIFFDGDISFSGTTAAVYEGRGTIYANGEIAFSGDVTLCGVPMCDEAWDSETNLLALVAGSSAQGGTFALEFQNDTVYQGAAYAVGDLREQNNAHVWGPVIANQLSIQNSARHHYEPIGSLLPGMPTGLVATLEDVEETYSG